VAERIQPDVIHEVVDDAAAAADRGRAVGREKYGAYETKPAGRRTRSPLSTAGSRENIQAMTTVVQSPPSQPTAIGSTQLRPSHNAAAQVMTLPNVPSTFQIPPSSHRPIPLEARDRRPIASPHPHVVGYKSPPKDYKSPTIGRTQLHSGSSGSDGGVVGRRYAEQDTKAARALKQLFEEGMPL
jgi:hypothetical protein